jgi:hypothetical protein
MGEPVRAKVLLQDSKELFDQLHAEDMVARVDSELRGLR